MIGHINEINKKMSVKRYTSSPTIRNKRGKGTQMGTLTWSSARNWGDEEVLSISAVKLGKTETGNERACLSLACKAAGHRSR